MFLADEPRERRGLVQIRKHDPRSQFFSAPKFHAHCAPFFDDDSLHYLLEPYLTTLRLNRTIKSFGQRTHAALHPPHQAAVAVQRQRVHQAKG
jgi:hypothetical protein